MRFRRQKRIYVDKAIVFVTIKTHDNFPYFEYDAFCNLFLEILEFCREYKGFKISAFKINPDHIHLLIQQVDKYNYSQIIGTIKRNFSRICNSIINTIPRKKDYKPYPRAEDSNPPRSILSEDIIAKNLLKAGKLNAYFNNLRAPIQDLLELYTYYPGIPIFKWQVSFSYHLIKDTRDFFQHIEYIRNQHIKHNLKNNKYLFIDGNLTE